MRVPAILLTKEGEIVEILARVFYTRLGPQIFGYSDFERNYRRRFVKCPKGCVARRTSSHVYDIYVDPNETIVNPYMTGFDIGLGQRIIGDVIVLKRPIYGRRFVSFHYKELANIYYVRRRIYHAGSELGRLLRIPLYYFTMGRLPGRRRSYGRVHRRQIHPKFFSRYSPDYRIRKAKGGYYFSGRRNQDRFYLPFFGGVRRRPRRKVVKKPIMFSNKRLVRRSPIRGRRSPIRGRGRRSSIRGRGRRSSMRRK